MRLLVCASLLSVGVLSAANPIIPQPVSYQEKPGACSIQAGAFVYAPQAELPSYLKSLNEATGLKLRMAPADAACAIQFLSGEMRGSQAKGQTMPDGAYHMRVLPKVVNIYADSRSGHFYGLQSLLQILRAGEKNKGQISVPCAEIDDAPRFAWRGFMLDESRHFSGEDAVKCLLDTMAYYKMNRFHWHLTDSPGWRIEIKKYPKLTSVGGIGNQTDPKAPAAYYTQDQIRDIVAYAKARHINVIPEIDMPGHASAACRAYPEFSGGGSKKHPDFTFNPVDPATDAFLNDILKEVAGLFPDAGVIHFGGDEVHFGWDQWPELAGVKKLMKEEGLKLKDIETRFNLRFAKVINGLGFKTGGWDEIARTGMDPKQSVVFWWRHNKPKELSHALNTGYDVVLCPRRPCYFDFVQHASHKSGRRWGGFNPLSDTYGFPDALKLPVEPKGTILGIQACLWTETTITQERRDFMTFPRLLALAEAAWTPKESKDFAGFEKRLQPQLPELKARGIGYYDPFGNSPEVKK
ncbi:beta-N-acetylhexosaminidase [Verrucomicrobiaceae bacterium N1E253]|uniref:beta-N-acetylhexosaminidase n=1 Tax=Oceaniferula marina TaxID=2748318 RepID=A0A851GMF2_9BACT|nr:beta-N-acetylhexosaminidase [Oceaniferula marina]NWK57021.1 beta-N-acetylhexosaminidase [Oceaniferula marina]